MGVLAEIGYEVIEPGRLQRGFQRFGATPIGRVTLAKTQHLLDGAVFRVTDGRHTATRSLSALPVVVLTTTGARSGQQRTSPLIGIPFEEDLAVIGSNYGQAAHPGWVYNLEQNPAASIAYRNRSVSVVARRATEPEVDHVFGTASATYAGFAGYRQLAETRTIRAFVLTLD